MVMIHGDYSWWSPINIIEGLILSIRSSQVFDIAEAQGLAPTSHSPGAGPRGQRWVVHQNHILASPKEKPYHHRFVGNHPKICGFSIIGVYHGFTTLLWYNCRSLGLPILLLHQHACQLMSTVWNYIWNYINNIQLTYLYLPTWQKKWTS